MSLKEVLFPVRWVYQGATGFRNWLYDRALLKSSRVNSKVISVGNLTTGGTGKTPVTLALIALLRARGHSTGVVSRGYKRQKKGVLEVVPAKTAALTFGDEPALIKATFPDVPVLVGERRVAAAQALLNERRVDFIICDDAFQHRRLHRDLNLLLFDVTESARNYRVLPVGRARESLVPALRRADFLILTKANLVEPPVLDEVREWLTTKTDKPILIAGYHVKHLRAVDGRTTESLRDAVYLVSGIAKPEALERTLGDRVKILKHRTFPDHHRYTDLEVEEILDEASRLQARWILTTAKDGMKLSAFARLRERLWLVELELQFSGDMNAFNETLDRLAGASH